MIEKDYISVIIKQFALLIAKLLRLKTAGDTDGMEEVIYDILKTAGIDGQNPLMSRDEIEKIEDERVLVSLHEALTVYLSVKNDIKLSLIDDWIIETLEERKKLILDI